MGYLEAEAMATQSTTSKVAAASPRTYRMDKSDAASRNFYVRLNSLDVCLEKPLRYGGFAYSGEDIHKHVCVSCYVEILALTRASITKLASEPLTRLYIHDIQAYICIGVKAIHPGFVALYQWVRLCGCEW